MTKILIGYIIHPSNPPHYGLHMSTFDLDHTFQQPFFAALSVAYRNDLPLLSPPLLPSNRTRGTTTEFGRCPRRNAWCLKEFYHIIFEHVTGRLPPEGMSKMWTVATDLAINSHLMGELPEGGCFPSVEPFQDYPVGLSAERYFSMLQNDEQFQPQEGDGESGEGGDGQPSNGDGSSSDGGLPDTLDDHDEGEASEEVRDMAKERLTSRREGCSGGRFWSRLGFRISRYA